MKVIVKYETEEKELTFDTQEIIYRYEVTSRLVRQRIIDFRNLNVNTIGIRLEGLLPETDSIEQMKSIHVYSDSGILVKGSNKVVNAYYRVTTQPQRENGGILSTPEMVETFLVEIE